MMVGTMGTMNTDIDLQNDPDIPKARQMIIDLVGAHIGPTPKELPQFTNVAFDPILSGDDTDNLRLLIHADYQAQSLIVSLPTGMTAWVMAGDEHGRPAFPVTPTRLVGSASGAPPGTPSTPRTRLSQTPHTKPDRRPHSPGGTVHDENSRTISASRTFHVVSPHTVRFVPVSTPNLTNLGCRVACAGL